MRQPTGRKPTRARQRKDGEHQHRDERDGDIGGGKGGEDEAAGEAALFLLGIFDRQRMSPGIAAAKTDTVEKAQNHQKPIGGDADLGIAGNERDQKRDDAKARDRRDRRRAAPEAIRHDAKRERPNRAPQQRRDEHERRENRLFAGIESRGLKIEKDGRQHHRRQIDVEHVDEFGEDGAADGSAPLLLPVRGFGDKPRR